MAESGDETKETLFQTKFGLAKKSKETIASPSRVIFYYRAIAIHGTINRENTTKIK